MTNEKRLENMIYFNAADFGYGVMCEVRRP